MIFGYRILWDWVIAWILATVFIAAFTFRAGFDRGWNKGYESHEWTFRRDQENQIYDWEEDSDATQDGNLES